MAFSTLEVEGGSFLELVEGAMVGSGVVEGSADGVGSDSEVVDEEELDVVVVEGASGVEEVVGTSEVVEVEEDDEDVDDVV